MIYSFSLPMLADYARKMVMGQMQYDEISRVSSTRGATSSVPAAVQVVSVKASLPSPATASVSTQVMVFECEGMMVSVPVGTAIKIDKKLSCRPRELLEQMKVDDALTEQRGSSSVYTGSVGSQFFQWQ